MPFKQVDMEALVKSKRKDPEYDAAYKTIEAEYQLVDQLIAARKASGLSQVELAKKVGVSQQAISRLENKRQMPTLIGFLRILNAVNLDLKLVQK